MQNISGKCFLGICLEAQQYFFLLVLLLIIQSSFRHSVAEPIFKVFICFTEKPQFLSLKTKSSFLNGGLLFLESIVVDVFIYFKSLRHSWVVSCLSQGMMTT